MPAAVSTTAAADDPAVWIHPQEPGLSLILGTDKQGGLHTYNMDGSELELVSNGAELNNVDVVYGRDCHECRLGVLGLDDNTVAQAERIVPVIERFDSFEQLRT
jgi:myo-inositol-hexaphosphate 3-phosphohydrolase